MAPFTISSPITSPLLVFKPPHTQCMQLCRYWGGCETEQAIISFKPFVEHPAVAAPSANAETSRASTALTVTGQPTSIKALTSDDPLVAGQPTESKALASPQPNAASQPRAGQHFSPALVSLDEEPSARQAAGLHASPFVRGQSAAPLHLPLSCLPGKIAAGETCCDVPARLAQY